MTDLKNAGSARFGEIDEGKTAVEGGNGTRMIQFGVFEADLRAGELRRKGSRVRLQEQPFQILMMLLQRPGEVITREELRKYAGLSSFASAKACSSVRPNLCIFSW